MIPPATTVHSKSNSCTAIGNPSVDGPFLTKQEQPRNLNPYALLVIGITLSVAVVTYHFISFRQHLAQAEQKLQLHVDHLKFAQEFAQIDEAMSIAARSAMQGRDRSMLARYLENESRMQKLLDQRFRAEANDRGAQKILLELRRTMRDLMKLEGGVLDRGKTPYFLTNDYYSARERIRELLHRLNSRILVSESAPVKSIHVLNEEFNVQNRVVIIGLVLFWLLLGGWIVWLRRSYDKARVQGVRERTSLEALVQSMPYGVVAIDGNGEFTLWNRAARDLVPEGPDHLPQVAWQKIMDPSHHVEEIDFGERTIRFSGRPIRRIDHQNPGAVIVFEDVTEMRRLERELNYQRQKQAHDSKMATLGEVAGHLAHEINTPLSTIQISLDGVERALEDQDRKTVKTYLHCILQAVRRMSNIVNAFRRYSHAGGEEERIEEVDLRQVLNDALEICAPDLRARGIALEKSIPSKPLLVECKPGSLSQAVINLMTNARDAVGKTPKGWVKLSLKENHGWVMIDVEDAGQGVDFKSKDKIFEPFFTTKPRGVGTGIGLGIVRDVARAHGGDIKFGLRDGHTCFELKFPKYKMAKNVV